MAPLATVPAQADRPTVVHRVSLPRRSVFEVVMAAAESTGEEVATADMHVNEAEGLQGADGASVQQVTISGLLQELGNTDPAADSSADTK